MRRNIWSALILIATAITAVIFYIVVFTSYDKIWFNFNAIFILSFITFLLGVGIFISAILVEPRNT